LVAAPLALVPPSRAGQSLKQREKFYAAAGATLLAAIFFVVVICTHRANSVNVTFRAMKNWKLAALMAAMFLAASALSQTATPADAIALEEQGKFPEAADAWRTVVGKNPQDAAAFASLGVVLSKLEKYDDAATAYRRAIALNPKLPGMQLNLGLAEFKRGHFQAAIVPLSAALRADASNAQARTLLGLSFYGAKRFAEAVKYLQPAAELDPGNLELHRVLAESCLGAKKYSCALEEFRQILQQNPDSAAAHVLVGEALDGMGKTAEAIAEFETASKAAPQEPNVHFGLGYLYWKSHQYDQAKSELARELSIDPGHAQALAYLGDIEMKRNDPGKALPLLEKSVSARQDIRIAYLDMGAIFTEQKRYPEAIAALQRAEKLDPTEPDAHFRLGRVYRAMGNKDAAQGEFAKVRELHEKADDVASKMVVPPAPVHP
jgi:tetratricopeptide (TPR) repeat protein